MVHPPKWATDPKTHRLAHFILTGFWLVMVYPTVFWWSESIKYLVFISVYTILVSHVTAWLAARTDEHQRQEQHMAGTPDNPAPEPQPQPQQPQQPERPDDDR